MSDLYPLKVYGKPTFKNASLIVTWNEDAGGLGGSLSDYLVSKLYGEEFAQLDPSDFFPLSGVAVENDIAEFPSAKFYYCEENIAVFSGNPPRSEWYRYLNTIIDVAKDYCHARELYTIGGMVTLHPHSVPRQVLGIANGPEMKEVLKQHGLASDMDYETPPGQRPTLNSFLLWCARRRNIMAATLWVPVPFYLVSGEDPAAVKRLLEFIDRRTGTGLDFRELDESITDLNSRISEIRRKSSTANEYLSRLENNIALTEEESEKLVKEMEEHLWIDEDG